MISIVVPVYKVEQYLSQCIESIIGQKFTDWELLLVDDGSPDKSGTICDKYVEKDKRIHVIHKENGGVSSARNLGIKEAKGEWIIFVDADDYIGENYISGLSKPILEGYQVDFIHGGCTNYEKGQITSVNQEYDYYVGNDKEKLFSLFRGLVVSKLFKTDILKKYNLLFDEGMKIAEDMAFTMDYLHFVESYAFVPEKNYYYRRDNDNSATHRIKWSSYQQAHYDFIHLYNSTMDYIHNHNISEGNAKLRYEQRAKQLFMMIRSMYHDNSFGRQKRLEELSVIKKDGYFELLHYWCGEKNDFNLVQFLLKNNYSRFDNKMLVKETIVKLRDCVKSLLST